ncbi:MAG: Tryptophan--tRNA ligase [Anaerolinea thermophila]|uniref:Tryptophan--tRNA ligase n=1 Tax=Anaerolinea thermophila TaxID=167964 RepID=A0A117LGK3_9CHLR|nr:MAG: Tryptophan--tRNA ligase [Anaerolinea thermophila]
MKPIALTGIKPTGRPHIGNYLGMYRPALELMKNYQGMYFVADYHALTTMRDPEALRGLVYEVAASWIALGLDPDEAIFFRQSDIPEIPEFTWILSCFTSKGLLNRAHAYKDAVDTNLELGRDPDEGINAGLFYYPVLMAADILLYGSDVVPVGLDQKQHIEITRDIAEAFNRTYGEVLKVPEGLIQESVMKVPGIDGRKMSKSYDNTIPIFAPEKQLRKRVMRIVTDSKRPEDPKDPEEDNLFALLRFFVKPERLEEIRDLYLHGGAAYGTLKKELADSILGHFADARTRFDELINDKAYLDKVLLEGAAKARAMGKPYLAAARKATGID